VIYTAEFGPLGDHTYRYKLGRDWSDEAYMFDPIEPSSRVAQRVLFIMLNPSTADAQQNDPTVAKCIRVARRLGYCALEVRNIFAIRGSDPAIIKRVDDPIGRENDQAIRDCVADPSISTVVAAWGNHGGYLDRASHIVRMLSEIQKPVYCFAISLQGQPVHPLYQREDRELKLWIEPLS